MQRQDREGDGEQVAVKTEEKGDDLLWWSSLINECLLKNRAQFPIGFMPTGLSIQQIASRIEAAGKLLSSVFWGNLTQLFPPPPTRAAIWVTACFSALIVQEGK